VITGIYLVYSAVRLRGEDKRELILWTLTPAD